MSRLTGLQLQQLQDAFLDAFPTQGALARMVRFGLNENLDVIAGTGTLADVVYGLLTWAEARGRTADLLAVAARENPQNPRLARVVFELETAVERRDDPGQRAPYGTPLRVRGPPRR